jgi:hypothetical protein
MQIYTNTMKRKNIEIKEPHINQERHAKLFLVHMHSIGTKLILALVLTTSTKIKNNTQSLLN